MNEFHYPKALTTLLRVGTAPDAQKYVIVPYEGNLTASKFDQLAETLARKIAPFYHNHQVPYESFREQVRKRLTNEWYTGREKNLALSKKENGMWLLEGENFWMANYPLDHFIIAE